MNYSQASISPFAGVRLIESEHAMALPSGRPFTDDMRDMVDHFHRLGLVKRKPAAFQTPQGLVIHPALLKAMQQQLSRQLDSLAEAAFFGAMR